MKVSVVISACDNRVGMFGRALDTWAAQGMPKRDFEIIVVDDAQRDDLRQLCRARSESDGLNIQFIRIDKSRSVIPVKSFIPVLTNNVGFKNANGEVVVVTGPETLQASGNMDVAWTMRDRMECAYGLVFRANVSATNYIANGWDRLRRLPLHHILQIPGAKAQCLTTPPHPPAYWYFMAVAKKHIEVIGGVDERFLGGLCAEDDDFANRMKMAGVLPVFDHRIVGIHQDHSREDHGDGIHIDRNHGIGRDLRTHNLALMRDNLARGNPLANQGHDWGSPDLVVLHDSFGKGKGERRMKLHLGCGTVYLRGYINIDSAPHYISDDCPPEILACNITEFDRYYKQEFGTLLSVVVADLEHNLHEPLPFPNGFVDEVVMYQVLEHIPNYDVDRLLSDIARVLRIGGTFIVSVPDIMGTAKLLVEAKTDEEEDWAIRLVHGTQRNQWSHHYCGYVPRTLKALLSKHGFGGFEEMPNINCYPVIHLKAIKER